MTPEEKARREKALEHPQSKEQEDIKHAANELDCCCLCSVVGEKKTKKKDRERERKLLLIRFDSLRFVPWFLGFEKERAYPQRGKPQHVQRTRTRFGTNRDPIRTSRSESKRKFEQKERKKRERASEREAQKRIVSYHIFCCRFLPSSGWNNKHNQFELSYSELSTRPVELVKHTISSFS